MSIDHLALMRAGLAQQFKGLPNLDAFIHAFGDQLNDVEEFYGQLLNNLTLPNAVGAQLDRLGVTLGQQRNGLSDSSYRTVLQARIVEYQSQGTVEDLIQVLLFLGGATQVQLEENFPAGFQVSMTGFNPVVSNGDIITAVLQTKLAGVGATILDETTLPAFTFDLPVGANNAGFDQGHLAGPLM